jgi:hypothetical protein
MKKPFKPLLMLMLLSSSLLTACGGGGDSAPPIVIDPEPSNQSPAVTISGDTSISEGETLTLSANASDSDGTIASISWSVIAGDGVTLSGADSENVSFTTPNIDADTTITLSVTVTDNDGASTTQEASISITALKASLTFTGLVTDNIISNANVEITIGGEVFSATADENGVYSITLTVDESLIDNLVQIRALGDSSINPEVEFVSQLGSLSSLVEQAGANGELANSDNFGVNVTNVTTAEYALLTRDGATPITDEELNAALETVNRDEKNTLAALIKIVVDNEDYDLPAGVASTLELVNESATAASFEQEVIAQEPDLITETISTIVNDNSLTAESAIVGTWQVGSDVITFTRSGHYVHITSEVEEDDCGQIGYEVGTYSWNEATGAMNFVTTEDSNACSGLHDEQPINTPTMHVATFTVNDDTLTIDEGDETFSASHLISDSNPFVGGYYLQNTNFSDDLSMLITVDDNTAVLLLKLNSSGLPSGVSYLYIMREYSYNPDTSLRIIQSQKVYVNGNITSENNQEVWRALSNVQGDVISMTNSDGTSFIKNSRTTTSQEYLSNEDIIGNFNGTYGDNNFNVTFNEDGTGHGSSDDGSSSFEWKISFGQLLVSQDEGASEIWSPVNLGGDSWQFNVLNYDDLGNFDSNGTGTLSPSETVVSPPTEANIVGSWALGDSTVLTFTDSGHYIHMEETNDDCGQSGYEVGTYIWKEDSGEISVSTRVDTNGCIGLHDDDEPLNTMKILDVSLIVDGDQMTISGSDGESISTRIINQSNAIIGAYYEDDFSAEFGLVVFIDDSLFMELIHRNTEQGLNIGRYSWNADSSLLDFGDISLNQLNDIYQQAVVKMQGDILIWKDDDEAGVMRRTHTSTEQPYFSESDVIGSFAGAEEGFAYTLNFNSDHTAQEVSSEGTFDYTWRIEFGQLILDDGWLLVASPTAISTDIIEVDIADFNLDMDTTNGEAGSFEYSSSSWIKN